MVFSFDCKLQISLHKIFERYKDHGLECLTDRSRRPVRYASAPGPDDVCLDRLRQHTFIAQ
jgi:hypothetical protein